MLFEEYKYFNHEFPDPQYLGAKHTHLAWIKKHTPNNVKTAIDAFAGSQSVAFLFKQMGFKTITNDFLNFNNQIGLALIENSKDKLTQEDISLLFKPSKTKKDFKLIEETFTHVFFEKSEADVVNSFEKLFEMAEEIPHWLISYNDRSYPSVEELTRIISNYKDVSVEHKTYSNGRGGKGSIAGSKEVLFICHSKKKHFIRSTKQTAAINERL